MIFISHSNKDIDLAIKVNTRLKQKGIPTWIDNNNIFPGGNWLKSIEEGLQTCSAGVFLLTNNSYNNENCANERVALRDYGKKFYVLKAETLEFLPWDLKTNQWIDISVDFGEGMNLLARAIKADVAPSVVASDDQIARRVVHSFTGFASKIVKEVKIVLDMTLTTFSTVKPSFIRLLSNLLGTVEEAIKIKWLREGSTIIMLVLPEPMAEQLAEFVNREPALFVPYSLRSIEIMPSAVALPSMVTEVAVAARSFFGILSRAAIGSRRPDHYPRSSNATSAIGSNKATPDDADPTARHPVNPYASVDK